MISATWTWLRMVTGYLLFRRDAAEALAKNQYTLWVGVVFVFIAAVARRYDQTSFVAEPLFLVTPLLLSIALAFLFFSFIYSIYIKYIPQQDGVRFGSQFRTFLSMFWMTAPLAWLYALPFERMTDPLTAAKLNVTLLAIVATWRVALFSWFLATFLQQRFWMVLANTLFGGSILAFVGSTMTNISIVGFMSGSDLTAAEEFVVDVTGVVGTASLILFFPTLIATVAIWRKRGRRAGDVLPVAVSSSPSFPWLSLTILSVITVTLAAGPQQNVWALHQIKSLTREGHYGEALNHMQAMGETRFTTWAAGENSIESWLGRGANIGMINELSDKSPQWMREQLIQRAQLWIDHHWFQYKTPWKDVLETAEVLSTFPEGGEFLLRNRDSFSVAITESLRGSPQSDIDRRLAELQAILDTLPQSNPQPP